MRTLTVQITHSAMLLESHFFQLCVQIICMYVSANELAFCWSNPQLHNTVCQ